MSHISRASRYQRNSTIALSISFSLTIISLYLFFLYYDAPSSWLCDITSQWCIASMFLGFCWHILATNPPPRLPRKEELINLTFRLIFLLPITATMFGTIQSKVDGVSAISSTLVLCVFLLSLDKSEIIFIIDTFKKKEKINYI